MAKFFDPVPTGSCVQDSRHTRMAAFSFALALLYCTLFLSERNMADFDFFFFETHLSLDPDVTKGY